MRSRPASRRSFRPMVEALEGRALLSVCTVDRLTDLGQGTGLAGDLRYCISQAQNGDSITFSLTGAVNLTSALPTLTRSVRIEGPGADLMIVRRAGGFTTYRVFTVAAGVTASISGLTISNGNAGGISNSGTLSVSNSTISGNIIIPGACCAGGAGVFNSGTLLMSNSTISGNTSVRGGHGAGIYSDFGGTVTITNSMISGNYVLDGAGGGIASWGGTTLTVSNSTISGNIASDGGTGAGISFAGRTLMVSNSTISGNTAAHDGGGIWLGGGMGRVSNSTISGNTAVGSIGGGIHHLAGSLVTRNTIIAGNMAPQGPDVFGNLGSQGYNLLGNPNDANGFHPTDLLNINPRLGPLQDNGGPTLTHALLPGSPPINAADPAAGNTLAFPKWDQRGPGFSRIASGRLDIGAFEVQGRGGDAGAPFAWGSADWADIMATAAQRPAVAGVPQENGRASTMTITTEATFENGMLKPKTPLGLAEGAEVRVTINALDADHDPLEAVIGIGEGPADGADNHAKYLSAIPKPSPPGAEELPADPEDPLEAVIGICDDGPPISLAKHHDEIIYGLLRGRTDKKP